jgi:hypothetical protein
MRKVSFLFTRFLLLVTLFTLAACVPSVRLAHSPLVKSDVQNGYVSVGNVNNLRPESNGGQSFQLLGKVRGGYGNPFSLNAEKGREIDVTLHEVMSDALLHTGYNVVTPADQKNALRLDIDVLEFWCDGYTGYNVTATIVAKLVDIKSGKSLAEKKIVASKGFALIMGYSPMHEAFNAIVDEITKELIVFMKSEEFRSAVQHA